MGAPQKMSDNDALALHYRNFNKVFDIMHPFFATSLIAWPSYWMFQGFRWGKRKSCLPLYIRETYKMSKLMTIGILSAGVTAVVLEKKNEEEKARKAAEAKKKRGWRG